MGPLLQGQPDLDKAHLLERLTTSLYFTFRHWIQKNDMITYKHASFPLYKSKKLFMCAHKLKNFLRLRMNQKAAYCL